MVEAGRLLFKDKVLVNGRNYQQCTGKKIDQKERNGTKNMDQWMRGSKTNFSINNLQG